MEVKLELLSRPLDLTYTLLKAKFVSSCIVY